MTTSPLKASVVAASTAALMISGAGIASAHITANPTVTTPNSYSVVTFSVPHGCGKEATTQVVIDIPREVLKVRPTVNPGWTISLKKEPVNPPVQGGHGMITERTSQITYTAKTPLPSAYRDKFELSMKLPQLAPGTTLRFPALQKCTTGETNWNEIPAPGADRHSVRHPAPVVTLTAPDGDDHGVSHNHGQTDIFSQLKAMFGSS